MSLKKYLFICSKRTFGIETGKMYLQHKVRGQQSSGKVSDQKTCIHNSHLHNFYDCGISGRHNRQQSGNNERRISFDHRLGKLFDQPRVGLFVSETLNEAIKFWLQATRGAERSHQCSIHLAPLNPAHVHRH